MYFCGVMTSEINTRALLWFTGIFFLVYTLALSIDVMNVDAAQYATISREMLGSSDWLQVTERGHDYLDKPPLLFWLSAGSFKIFGISNWAYKLPSFLFAILAVFSTVRLAALFYDRKIALLSGLMLASSFGFFVMMNDVRTDMLLMSTVIFSIWQLQLYLRTKSWIHLAAGFIGIGAAMLTKGPIGLIIPVLAIAFDTASKKNWSDFFKWQWLFGLLIIGLMLLPMCIGLYQQFDLHPEKMVNGKTGVSGLRFYFWTQSFGRFTGESDWGTKFDNGASPFFFTHTFLWSFFPWSLLVLGALIKQFIEWTKVRFKSTSQPELISFSGFVLSFLIMSISRYKLPHYINITFPFAAILAARFFANDILHLKEKYLTKVWMVLHSIFTPALFLAASLICYFVFPNAPVYVNIVLFTWFIAALLFLWKLKTKYEKLLYPLLCGLLAFYFIGNSYFYPNLMKYQATAMAAKFIDQEKASDHYSYYGDFAQFPGDFYSAKKAQIINGSNIDSVLAIQTYLWLYTDSVGVAELAIKYPIKQQIQYADFSVQFLSAAFLNPATRQKTLRDRYLVRISK
jgi:4-amino-4-deoxy-L-arabinose transferase-like glycosyltransferase